MEVLIKKTSNLHWVELRWEFEVRVALKFSALQTLSSNVAKITQFYVQNKLTYLYFVPSKQFLRNRIAIVMRQYMNLKNFSILQEFLY